jgi:hypothetical protein
MNGPLLRSTVGERYAGLLRARVLLRWSRIRLAGASTAACHSAAAEKGRGGSEMTFEPNSLKNPFSLNR